MILTNGTPIRASNDFAAGTSVSISLRPERAKITQQKEDGDPLSSVSGVVETITYLGNARVYSVKFTWMSLEVREENRPGVELYEPGTPITVSWDHDAISVVAD